VAKFGSSKTFINIRLWRSFLGHLLRVKEGEHEREITTKRKEEVLPRTGKKGASSEKSGTHRKRSQTISK